MGSKDQFIASATSIQLDLGSNVVEVDTAAFDLFSVTHGVTLVHYYALPCPVGLISPFDQRRPGSHDGCSCSNGYLLTKAGEVTVVFQHNTHEIKQLDTGRHDGSVVQVTFPRFYDGTEDYVRVLPQDRFYLKEELSKLVLTVEVTEQFHHHISNKDRVKFPVVAVSLLVDSGGIKYTQGVDFIVESGYISWYPGKGPPINAETGIGAVCSIRYCYRPYWICSKLLHEIRVAQTATENGREVQRMQMAAILAREYYYQNTDQDPRTANTLRKAPAAPGGSFGPR